MKVKAIIKVDVPEWQIGEEAQIFFPDSMCAKGICELATKDNDIETLLNEFITYVYAVQNPVEAHNGVITTSTLSEAKRGFLKKYDNR